MARKEFLSKGHPHLRVSALAKRYGWGIHNNAEGKLALIAVESPQYERLLSDPRTTKMKAFAPRARDGMPLFRPPRSPDREPTPPKTA
jgi:hypothetical protein